MIFIESTSTNPAFNLALEEYVFDYMPKDQEYFMLWQNENTIVVGKHQNTVEEINAAYVKERGIQVVRRLSGGGAVYHDLGNINFTFVVDADNIEQLNLQAFCQPVVKTLERLGVEAEQSGRNDITIDGKKFSGNSQYIKGKRIMHHGTLMFDSDLSVVAGALKVTGDKIQSKGFKSIRSRVTNIRPHIPADVDLERFKQVLREYMVQGEMTQYTLTKEDIEEVKKIQRERYDTWEWNYGASPEFQIQKSRRIEGCGKIDISMNVENGVITDYDSRGDYFGEGATPELKEKLIGCRLEEGALQEALKGFGLGACYSNLSLDDYIEVLCM
ncbi:lipoate-protein ligase A [Aequitasia blattaphilus]|uniref:lipoate--protein ligase n=1 Tax=Aequitasia blattaphilus TaxID=2949332 RepID=A0ABT1EEP5_9FIRM|nr:lipoate--protein ligase [Aequitasia blattaphilus]MCP1102937.1 lipoate--protein ligase [Aequitasia blattaphilus]MCR8615577.1 lipoate--protein ligase [Aequitasia blattaphilus]